MKRKLIARNKAKMTNHLKNMIRYKIVNVYDSNWNLTKNSEKYNSVYDYENAYRRSERSKMILVPVLYTSKNRRSRIRNKFIGSLCVSNVELFNEQFNVQRELNDFPVGYKV